MKKLGILVLLSVFMMGCDNPKKVVIPIGFESKKMEEFGERIKSLSEEDKELLNSYITRSKNSEKSSNYSIPTGTTVGEAIKNERQWQAEKEYNLADFRNAVEVSIADLGYREGSVISTLRIENNSDKDIVGIKGNFEIYDNFGEPTGILSYAVKDINVGVGEYSNIEVYPSIDNLDQSIYDYPDNFNPESVPEILVFSDGARIEIKN